MKIPILKKDNKYYIELPDDLGNAGEVEIFALRNGFYLLTSSLENVRAGGATRRPTTHETSSAVISEDEKQVLRKLIEIKFEKRVPKLIEKLFSQKESAVLSTLVAKDYVNIYVSKKYPDGVYNIKDEVYPLLRQNTIVQNPAQTQQAMQQQKTESSEPRQTDFRIINDAREAQDFSERYKKQLRSGELIGVRGFDGKFYAVSKEYYNKMSSQMKKILEKDADVGTISKITNTNQDAVKAVLTIMADRGDVLEKKKGVYALV